MAEVRDLCITQRATIAELRRQTVWILETLMTVNARQEAQIADVVGLTRTAGALKQELKERSAVRNDGDGDDAMAS